MSLDQIAGQQRVKKQIAAWLAADRLPHAILIAGPEGVGKRHLALELAKAVNCLHSDTGACGECSSCQKTAGLTHPDFHTLLPIPAGTRKTDPDRVPAMLRESALAYLQQQTRISHSSSNIAREHIRSVQREMAYAPTEGRRRVAVIFEADCMQSAGSNSLLKILEEPPKHALFVLLSGHPDRLLPTIISRCQRLQLRPLSREELRQHLLDEGVEATRAELAARAGDGSLFRARQVLEQDGEFEEARRLASRFLKGGFSGDDGDYWSILEELGPRPDRARLETLLGTCAVYLRDLFLTIEDREHDVVYADRLSELREWTRAHRFASGGLEAAALGIDDAYDHMAHNVSAQLILAEMWTRVRSCVTPTGGGGGGDTSTAAAVP